MSGTVSQERRRSALPRVSGNCLPLYMKLFKYYNYRSASASEINELFRMCVS
jgi:hypothetical protein